MSLKVANIAPALLAGVLGAVESPLSRQFLEGGRGVEAATHGVAEPSQLKHYRFEPLVVCPSAKTTSKRGKSSPENHCQVDIRSCRNDPILQTAGCFIDHGQDHPFDECAASQDLPWSTQAGEIIDRVVGPHPNPNMRAIDPETALHSTARGVV
ncbi:MAG: hypothetical protein P8Y44_03195 [Acidobacteriota bacterium]